MLHDQIIDFINTTGITSTKGIQEEFECSVSTVERARRALRKNEFTNSQAPPEDLDVPTLLRRKSESYQIYKSYRDHTKLIPIQVNIDGPIGICHFGDPHIDDDGCDIDQLINDVAIVHNTIGMFAGNVGDTVNNWVGRLAELYNKQSTTAKQGWALTEWLIKSLNWLYIVGGNHIMWSGHRDPLQWLIGQTGNYGPSSVRMALNFSNGREVRVNVRHDFKGHSQWNQTHGSMKAAQMGWRDHILANGHKHISGQGFVIDPSSGLISHCLQVATYKIIDDYAEQLCLPNQNVSPNVTTIIDPDAKLERQLVTVFWDLEYAADYLNFLRKKNQRKRSN